MKIMQEVTDWATPTPNHIYVFDDRMNSIIAYVPEGTDRVVKFKSPIAFDRGGRKFEPMDDTPNTEERRVTGSKGQQYILTRHDGQWHCSCPGYQYHGRCRHQDIV